MYDLHIHTCVSVVTSDQSSARAYVIVRRFRKLHFQLSFGGCRATEPALSKVVNYLLLTMDSDHSSVLLLIDLTAGFGTTDR